MATSSIENSSPSMNFCLANTGAIEAACESLVLLKNDKQLLPLSGTVKRLAVLGATSGDTGSAAIHGCLGQEGITIFILYPQGRVAPLQERQMACTGAANVFAIPVPGTFDDAQRVVKEVFGNAAFAAAQPFQSDNSPLRALYSARFGVSVSAIVFSIWLPDRRISLAAAMAEARLA